MRTAAAILLPALFFFSLGVPIAEAYPSSSYQPSNSGTGSYPAYNSGGDGAGGGYPGTPTSNEMGGATGSSYPSPASNSGNWNPAAQQQGNNPSTMALYQQQQQPAAGSQMPNFYSQQNPYANGANPWQAGAATAAGATVAANQFDPNAAGAAQAQQQSQQNPYNAMANPMSALSAGGQPPGGPGPTMGMNMLGFGFDSPMARFGGMPGNGGFNPYGGQMPGGMPGMYQMPGMPGMPSQSSMFGMNSAYAPYYGGGGGAGGMPGGAGQSPLWAMPGNAAPNPMAQYG